MELAVGEMVGSNVFDGLVLKADPVSVDASTAQALEPAVSPVVEPGTDVGRKRKRHGDKPRGHDGARADKACAEGKVGKPLSGLPDKWKPPYPVIFDRSEFKKLQFVSPGQIGSEGMAAWKDVSFRAYFLMDASKPALKAAQHNLYLEKRAGFAEATVYWRGKRIGEFFPGPHNLAAVRDERYRLFCDSHGAEAMTKDAFLASNFMSYKFVERSEIHLTGPRVPTTMGNLIAMAGLVMLYFTGVSRDPRVVLV